MVPSNKKVTEGNDMSAEERMTVDERRKYLKKMLPLYLAANREEKGKLLTQMQCVTGMERKGLIRLMRSQQLDRKQRTKVRTRSYGQQVEQIVGVVWEALDYICVERLKGELLPIAQHLARFGELTLTTENETQLESISESTLQRMTGRMRCEKIRLPRKGPSEANRLRREVPMERIEWDTQQAGHFEVDLVHHSGASSAGEYLHTLQFVDVATGWSERVAIMGRSGRAMEVGFRRVCERLPFEIIKLHPDNGAEFFNDHLIRFFGEELTGMRLSRSRPYQKNDNRFVEQKNYTLVRAYTGHSRLDTSGQLHLLNEVYELMWVYYNFFQPVMHLEKKTHEDGKLVRKWDIAKTPYERLKLRSVSNEEDKERLERLYKQTNPRQLRQQIYRLLSKLWKVAETQSPQKGGMAEAPVTFLHEGTIAQSPPLSDFFI